MNPGGLVAQGYPKKPPESPRKPKTKTAATTEQTIAIHVFVSSQFSLSPSQSSHKLESHVKCRLHVVEFSDSYFNLENHSNLLQITFQCDFL